MKISRWSQSAESAFVRAMELVGADCTDEEMRDAIISAADGDTTAIEEALAQVQEDMRRESRSYTTDRTIRVFTAAIQKGPVLHVDNAYAELYERERRLDKLPLYDAINELCRLSTAVRQYCEDMLRTKMNKYGKTGLVRSSQAENDLENEVDALVGPKSGREDPLLRSPTASGVVMSWVREITGLASDED